MRLINSLHFPYGDQFQSTYPLSFIFGPGNLRKCGTLISLFISSNPSHLEPSPDLGQTGGQHAERGWCRPYHHYGLARLTDSSEY